MITDNLFNNGIVGLQLCSTNCNLFVCVHCMIGGDHLTANCLSFEEKIIICKALLPAERERLQSESHVRKAMAGGRTTTRRSQVSSL